MTRLQSLGSPAAWLRRICAARYGQAILFMASFLEAIVLPIPLEAILAPYMQLRRDILWWLAGVGLAGFLAAALAGYAVGALFFDDVGEPFVRSMGWSEEFAEADRFLAAYGFWALLAIAVTPIPTQIAMIGAGAVGYPLLPFLAAMALARGGRYFALAVLVRLYGDRIVRWIVERRGGTRAAADPGEAA